MIEHSTYVGMDDDKKRVVVAMLLPGSKEPVEWETANTLEGIRKLARRLRREGIGEILCGYEAGPNGYTLQRRLVAEGVRCLVAAPSLTPVKPGQRVKTNRRDARKLAECLRAGTLTEVHPPSEEAEAVRDLTRCREDLVGDRMRARHRISKLALRRGLVWRQGRAWTQAHRQWLQSIRFEHQAEQIVLEDYLLALDQIEVRLRAMEATIKEVAEQEPYRTRVGWLRCFRGIDTIMAMIILNELYDFQRFTSPRQLMAYLGLVPSESSTGDSVRRGGITKTGNSHVRRGLIEVSWHYRHPAGVGPILARRREGQPGWVVAVADKAQVRLHRRLGRLLVGYHKPPGKAIVAVARELVGFIWAVLRTPSPQPSTSLP